MIATNIFKQITKPILWNDQFTILNCNINNFVKIVKMKNIFFTIFIAVTSVGFATCSYEHDITIKGNATDQLLNNNVEDFCGPPLTCNYYLDTPCIATCWHNTWDIRDHECQKIGSNNCRWSFDAPWIMGGTCYCCDLKC